MYFLILYHVSSCSIRIFDVVFNSPNLEYYVSKLGCGSILWCHPLLSLRFFHLINEVLLTYGEQNWMMDWSVKFYFEADLKMSLLLPGYTTLESLDSIIVGFHEALASFPSNVVFDRNFH